MWPPWATRAQPPREDAGSPLQKSYLLFERLGEGNNDLNQTNKENL
jgi:hypothetical protein